MLIHLTELLNWCSFWLQLIIIKLGHGSKNIHNIVRAGQGNYFNDSSSHYFFDQSNDYSFDCPLFHLQYESKTNQTKHIHSCCLQKSELCSKRQSLDFDCTQSAGQLFVNGTVWSQLMSHSFIIMSLCESKPESSQTSWGPVCAWLTFGGLPAETQRTGQSFWNIRSSQAGLHVGDIKKWNMRNSFWNIRCTVTLHEWIPSGSESIIPLRLLYIILGFDNILSHLKLVMEINVSFIPAKGINSWGDSNLFRFELLTLGWGWRFTLCWLGTLSGMWNKN